MIPPWSCRGTLHFYADNVSGITMGAKCTKIYSSALLIFYVVKVLNMDKCGKQQENELPLCLEQSTSGTRYLITGIRVNSVFFALIDNIKKKKHYFITYTIFFICNDAYCWYIYTRSYWNCHHIVHIRNMWLSVVKTSKKEKKRTKYPLLHEAICSLLRMLYSPEKYWSLQNFKDIVVEEKNKMKQKCLGQILPLHLIGFWRWESLF